MPKVITAEMELLSDIAGEMVRSGWAVAQVERKRHLYHRLMAHIAQMEALTCDACGKALDSLKPGEWHCAGCGLYFLIARDAERIAPTDGAPHTSDCPVWVGERCSCPASKREH